MGEYLNWLKNDYRPALEKAGVAHFQVSRPIFGAAAGEIVTTRMLKNLAEIDGGPILSKALTQEQANAVNAKSVALVSSSTTSIVRVRTELSYPASSTTAHGMPLTHPSPAAGEQTASSSTARQD